MIASISFYLSEASCFVDKKKSPFLFSLLVLRSDPSMSGWADSSSIDNSPKSLSMSERTQPNIIFSIQRKRYKCNQTVVESLADN